MPPYKAYCLLSSGSQFAHVAVFNRDGKSLALAHSQLQFKVSVTEPSDVVKAGMAKQTEGRRPRLSPKAPPSVSSLVGRLVGWLGFGT
jgi:hypothetical protein